MAVIETWYNQDLQQPVKVHYLDGSLFSHNGNGNRIGVHVFNNGEPVTLSGTVSGYVVTADGSTVPCTGSRSGQDASILIPAAAYQPGAIFITVFLTDGSTVTTLASVATNVLAARTGNQVSPGSVVTDWTQTINAAMQAVVDANAANMAVPYESLTYPVPLGKYTLHDNLLYRCIFPIASSEAWTASHWTRVKLGDDITDLKSAIGAETQRIRDGVFVNPSPELYNKNLSTNHLKIQSGIYAVSSTYTGVIIPIDNTKGNTVTVKKTRSAIFAVSTSATSPDVGVSTINENTDNSANALTIPITNQVNFVYVIYYNSQKDTLTEEQIKDTISVFYGTTNINLSYSEEIGEITERLSGYFVHHKSENLFDKSDTVDGEYMDRSGKPVANNKYFYQIMPLNGSGTYKFLGASTLFGTSKVLSIPYYDSEKTYLGYLTGTHWGEGTGNEYGVAFTITDAQVLSGVSYVSITQHNNNKDTLMVVKDEDYPSTYIPYYDYYQLTGVDVENVKNAKLNPLYLKTALFFGDSICNGSSANDGKSGYAGRIGTANNMDWHNYGYNGATIAEIIGHHCIAADVVTAYSTYPNADFIILEGGTNDADNLQEEGIGTYSETDFSGSYDTTTFSGAFETMLYNAVQQWPHAQIGYISAHKMGNGTNRERRRTYFLRAQELCKKWGIQFIDLWIESKLNRDLSAQYDPNMTGAENIAAHKLYTDGQHLTPDGYDLIAPAIEWWMCGL